MPNDQEFRVHAYGRSFCLRASSDVERAEWVFALQLVTKDAQADDANFIELARRQHREQVAQGQHLEPRSADSSGRSNISSTSLKR